MKTSLITLTSIILTFAVLAFIVMNIVGPAFNKLASSGSNDVCGTIHKVSVNCTPKYDKMPLDSTTDENKFA